MARNQTYQRSFKITLSVRKKGAGGMYRVKDFIVKALNLLDADVYARQAARKQGLEVNFIHDREELTAKALRDRKVIFYGRG